MTARTSVPSARQSQPDPILVPVAITIGAVAGAVLGALKARNQPVRPGFYSGWSGYGTVVGACLGFAFTAGRLGAPRKGRRQQ